MHPRNLYQHPPDFELLADAYPALKQYLIGRKINFQDEAAQRCLTEALLHHDFNLTVELPSDRLCPPVPNRLNYVLWIQDIVQAHTLGIPRRFGNERTMVQGVDIGTGASAIYTLLASTLEPTWRFVATELDPWSFASAQKNVASNGLGNRIRVVKVDSVRGDDVTQGQETGLVFGFDRLFEEVPGASLDTEHGNEDPLTIEFTMCNPPFYSALAEVEAAKGGWDKKELPSGVCTGAPVEMVTPGGEAQFVSQMVRESVRERQGSDVTDDDTPRKRRRTELGLPPTLASPIPSLPPDQNTSVLERTGQRARSRFRSRWYTSMLGKLSSVTDVVDAIRGYNITNYAITEFVQGQTRRWAVGWSLDAFRMPDTISRIDHPNPTLQHLMPARNILHFPIPGSNVTLSGCDSICLALRSILASIDDATVEEYKLVQEEEQGRSSESDQHCLPPGFLVRASCDSWSRRARRKRGRGDDVTTTTTTHSLPENKDKSETMSGFLAKGALVCFVRCTGQEFEFEGEDQRNAGAKRLGLEFQWVYGRDRVLFESFVSHVGRRICVSGLDRLIKSTT